MMYSVCPHKDSCNSQWCYHREPHIRDRLCIGDCPRHKGMFVCEDIEDLDAEAEV